MQRRFAELLAEALLELGLDGCGLTPASLRAGGATEMYVRTRDTGLVQFAGRWRSPQSLLHYIQGAMATMVLYRIPLLVISTLAKLIVDLAFMSRPPLKPWTSFFHRPASDLITGLALASFLHVLPDGGAGLVRGGHPSAARAESGGRSQRRRDLRAGPRVLPQGPSIMKRQPISPSIKLLWAFTRYHETEGELLALIKDLGLSPATPLLATSSSRPKTLPTTTRRAGLRFDKCVSLIFPPWLAGILSNFYACLIMLPAPVQWHLSLFFLGAMLVIMMNPACASHCIANDLGPSPIQLAVELHSVLGDGICGIRRGTRFGERGNRSPGYLGFCTGPG